MTRDEIRLELLKIAYAHGRSVAETVDRVKLLEVYLFSNTAPDESEKKKEKRR